MNNFLLEMEPMPDSNGRLWFAFRHGNGGVLFVAPSSDTQKISQCVGPMTLVYREDGTQ